MYLLFHISLKLPQRVECEIFFQFVTDPGWGLYKGEISKRQILQYFHVWQVFLWWSLEKVVTSQKERGGATKKKYFMRKYQVQVERCCPDIYKHYLHATKWQKDSSGIIGATSVWVIYLPLIKLILIFCFNALAWEPNQPLLE